MTWSYLLNTTLFHAFVLFLINNGKKSRAVLTKQNTIWIQAGMHFMPININMIQEKMTNELNCKCLEGKYNGYQFQVCVHRPLRHGCRKGGQAMDGYSKIF